MINMDCKHMTREDKLSVKDLLIVGAEFLGAIACGVGIVVMASLIVVMLG